MKHNTSHAGAKGDNTKRRVENKDDIDSRKNEEQEVKGDDTTHNIKDTKAKHLKQKK